MLANRTSVQAPVCVHGQERGIESLIRRINRWHINWKTRRQLRGQSDYLLKDIGISRSDAEQEARKPFWKD